MKRRVGRPQKLKEDAELITADEAVVLIKEELFRKYRNEAIVEKMSYSKRTLYNMRSQHKLHAYGNPKCALFDKEEIIKKLCG